MESNSCIWKKQLQSWLIEKVPMDNNQNGEGSSAHNSKVWHLGGFTVAIFSQNVSEVNFDFFVKCNTNMD